MDTLKVKDHGYTYRILMAFCTFPLAFLAVAFALDEDYALAAVMVLSVYSIAFVFFVRYLRKSEEVYLIVADKYGVTFLKQGKYRWADIVALESFIKVGY